MAPAASAHDANERTDVNAADAQPPAKRAKHDKDAAVSHKRVLAHPFGVKPIGNFYEDMDKGVRDCRAPGLGQLACLSDMHVLSLLNCLSATDLCVLAACSRACYIFSSHDELWRTLVLEEMLGAFEPRATWKASYIVTKCGPTRPEHKPIVVEGLYSDLLFQSFYCAAAPIEASWLAVNTIDRRSTSELSVDAFKSQYERGNRPVILTDAIAAWPALAKWTDEYLVQACKGETFYAGGFQFPLDQYLRYSRTLVDDQPLFIFDKHFAANVPALAADYCVPSYFSEDLFDLLGSDRPDYRWLIIGPAKSGSSFHIDPNATNAWNGVVRGSKKWILFPPDVVPPGVHPSDDGSAVSSPVSLIEWFVTFYPQIRKLPPHKQPLEGVCKAGELVFVPHGWWHLVLNVSESIAITQNYVSSENVSDVLTFVRDKPAQVSGLPHEKRDGLFDMFRDALQQHEPALFAAVERQWAAEHARKNRKTKWELLLQRDGSSDTTQQGGDAVDGDSSSSSVAPASAFGFGFTFD